MEASTIQSTATLCPPRMKIGPRLLRLRSDEQLVALFRAGHDEAFQVLYDRYRKRLEAYARRMLTSAQDAEDVLQEVFVRAHRALLTGDRELAVKAWLFRIVHNRCIDELRRMSPPVVELVDNTESNGHDPASEVDARDSLRRLLEDIRRLPEQQRSALLLRELSGISYAEVASVLDTSVPAVKSLLVRARMGLVRASEARDTACAEIRDQLTEAHEHGVRASSTVRSHLRDCQACRSYRREIFLVRKRVAALAPLGPVAALARLIGLPGGGATGGGAGSAVALGGSGAASGAAIGAGHVATLVVAAIASAGGAVELQHAIGLGGQPPARTASASHRAHARAQSTAAASSATGSSGWSVPTGTRTTAAGQPRGTGWLGESDYGQARRGMSTRGDTLISTGDTGGGGGQGQSTGVGGTGTQTGSSGSGSGSGSTTGSPGSVTDGSGSSGTSTTGPGATEGAGVGVAPVTPGAGGTTGTGSTTSTGATTTVGGTTVGTTGMTGGSTTGTAGDVTGTGQGTTTAATNGSTSGQTSSSSTTTTGSGS